MNDRLNWLSLAYKFAIDGDPKAMRACARELFDLNEQAADGPAIMALAAIYAGNNDEAAILTEDAMAADAKSIHANLAQAALWSLDFEIDKEIKLLKTIVKESTDAVEKQEHLRRELSIRILRDKNMPKEESDAHRDLEAKVKILRGVLILAQGLLADALALAADPAGAAKSLLALSELVEDEKAKALYYGKYLFMLNYRAVSAGKLFQESARFDGFFKNVKRYSHDAVKKNPKKKLRVGYISPDFRLHSVAYFLRPLLKDFDRDNFIVHCYSTGKSDGVTNNIRRLPIQWRDLRGKPAAFVAKVIFEDHIDILVDLSGHSQNNCLEVLAYRPAPVQISAIGYVATTGLNAVDYFLSDNICMSGSDNTGFTEKLLRLPCCHLCYSPGLVRQMPPPAVRAPVTDNGYVTFGCFNNFNKVTDELLCTWRSVMERVADSRLIIKGKICSIAAGRRLLLARLKGLSFDLSRIELRPFSPDYLNDYRDIDIALDTFPYNGGLTTCEALFMGVPVVTMRGRTHGSRFGASILSHADLKELVAQNQMEYVKKILQLAGNKDILQRYHNGLREHMHQSGLMNGKGYMMHLEKLYRQVWEDFCKAR